MGKEMVKGNLMGRINNSVHRKYRFINVSPTGGALGAEIKGVNISLHLKREVVLEIRQAFLDHLMIFFQNQELTPQEQLAFSRQFGQPMEYPQLKGLPECPMITEVIKMESEELNFGGIWHSDTTYLKHPPMGSMLYAVKIPPYGGDTLFANQYLAYDTLSEGLKKTLGGLVSISTSTKLEIAKTRDNRLSYSGEKLKVLCASHPVVRTHPETGHKALFVNTAHTTHFEGWTMQESQPLLDYLFEHQVRSEFTYRLCWRPGSLAFWDNRCTQHNPVNDYLGFKRIMHRVTIEGDEPS